MSINKFIDDDSDILKYTFIDIVIPKYMQNESIPHQRY